MKPEPLTLKEQIYAIALRLGKAWNHRAPGEEEKLLQGLAMLGSLYDEDVHDKELLDFKARTKECPVHMEPVDSSAWPSLDKDKDKESEAELPLHQMDRKDAILCLAIGMGKLAKAKAPLHTYKPGLRMLKKMVTDKEVEWAKGIMKAGMQKCGCAACKKGLQLAEVAATTSLDGGDIESSIEAILKKLNEDKPDNLPKAKPDPGWDDEDPFRSLSA